MKFALKVEEKKGAGWRRQDWQTLAVVEAEVGYMGNPGTILSAPAYVSVVQISGGRSRPQICQLPWINALLHRGLALNSASCCQACTDTCALWLFLFGSVESSIFISFLACFWDDYSETSWSLSQPCAGSHVCTRPAICVIPKKAKSSDSSDCRCQSCLWYARWLAGEFIVTQPRVVTAMKGRGVFPQEVKWLLFLLEGFLKAVFHITSWGKKMWCTSWTPRRQGSFGVFETFSVSGKSVFYRWRQGHEEETVKHDGNSPESTARPLADPDLELNTILHEGSPWVSDLPGAV